MIIVTVDQSPQEHADRLRIFREELDRLERQKVLELSPEQRATVKSYLDRALGELAAQFGVDTTESQRQMSLGMRIASALGGLALCIALALFAARYLGDLPLALQTALLIALPLILTAGADVLSRRNATVYYAELISIVAFAAFVLNLSVLAGRFNVSPTPNALAVWGLFAVALAYRFGLQILLVAGLVTLISWAGATATTQRGVWWLEVGDRAEDFLFAGAAVTFLPLLIHHTVWTRFPSIYRIVGSSTFFLTILFLSITGHGSYLPWKQQTIERVYQFAGLLAAPAAIWLGIRRDWSSIANLGALFFAVFLLVRLADWWWDWMPKYLFFFLIGVIAILLIMLFRRMRGQLGRTR